MTKLHGAESAPKPTAALCKELDLKGTLHVLRRGFKFYGKIFRMVYFKPVHGLNPDILDLYAQNRLAITRQIPCHPGEHKTVDLVFALNGLPVATCELKNPITGQIWRRRPSVSAQPRTRRAPVPLPKTRPRPLCRRSRRSPHDHPTRTKRSSTAWWSCNDERVIQTANANPPYKFELGIRSSSNPS